VFDFAQRLADRHGLPFVPALTCTKEVPEQKMMANSSMQARNVHSMLAVTKEVRSGPVLLVDDIIDSGWTMTVAGWLLRKNGSGPVYPFALARATVRNN
jgi:ATP-dependent DNA helicase RecQ